MIKELDLLYWIYVIYRKLEEDIMICETEKICLQNKLAKMEEEISLMKKSINSNSKTEDILINNSNNDIKQDKVEDINNKTKSKEKDVNSKEENQSITVKIIYCNLLYVQVVFIIHIYNFFSRKLK